MTFFGGKVLFGQECFPRIRSQNIDGTVDKYFLSICQKIYDLYVGCGGMVLLADSDSGRDVGYVLLMVVVEEKDGVKKYPLYNFVPFTANWHLVKYFDFSK